MPSRILSIGQCGYDDSRLADLVRQAGATLECAATGDDALRRMLKEKFDLILVNRVFDADGASGIALIEEFKRKGVQTPMMLVSNYAEAQADAVNKGAVQGFGKSDLGRPMTLELVRKVLNSIRGSTSIA